MRCAPAGQGKPATTRVRRLASAGDLHWLECRPESGRRHQIRVHLQHLGLPILGDPLYRSKPGEEAPRRRDVPAVPRLALHAHELEIEHPGTHERLAMRSPAPADLAELTARFAEIP